MQCSHNAEIRWSRRSAKKPSECTHSSDTRRVDGKGHLCKLWKAGWRFSEAPGVCVPWMRQVLLPRLRPESWAGFQETRLSNLR